VVEREKIYDNIYLRGRACIESVRGSWFQGEFWVWAFLARFVLVLSFSLLISLVCRFFVSFIGLAAFPSSRWSSWAFLDLSGILAVLHGVLDSNFILFVINELINGEIEKPSGQFLDLIVMNHWLGKVWIWIRDISVFTFIFVSCGESRLLISWCARGRCGMAGNDEDHGSSWRPSVEDRGWSHMLGTRWPDDREVGWCRVRSALCTWRRGAWISWLSFKTKVDGLSVVWP
jgi:hypothetical protein